MPGPGPQPTDLAMRSGVIRGTVMQGCVVSGSYRCLPMSADLVSSRAEQSLCGVMSAIVSDIAIVMRALHEVYPDPNNPRVNGSAVEVVAASIRRYGFLVPLVVDSQGKIVAGHTRLLAAQMLKLEKVPTITADGLTPEQLREFSVAENRSSDFAFFDMSRLAEMAVDFPEDFVADFDIASLLDGTSDDLEAIKQGGNKAEPEKRAGLDLAPFEKYQYVTIICRTTYDYTNLLDRLGLENTQARYVGKYLKRGHSIGRIIEYPDFIGKVGP